MTPARWYGRHQKALQVPPCPHAFRLGGGRQGDPFPQDDLGRDFYERVVKLDIFFGKLPPARRKGFLDGVHRLDQRRTEAYTRGQFQQGVIACVFLLINAFIVSAASPLMQVF